MTKNDLEGVVWEGGAGYLWGMREGELVYEVQIGQVDEWYNEHDANRNFTVLSKNYPALDGFEEFVASLLNSASTKD